MSRKRYSSSKSQIRKSIGVQLDFTSLLNEQNSKEKTVDDSLFNRTSLISNSSTIDNTDSKKISNNDDDSRSVEITNVDEKFQDKLDLIPETKKLSYFALDLRRAQVADFADPSVNGPDPIKTYNVKKIDSKFRNAATDSGHAIDHNHISRSTFLRTERAKFALNTYYLAIDRFFQPFKESEDSPPVVLGWNPLQIIRNRKAIKKDPNYQEPDHIVSHPLPSTQMSTTKKNFLWEISSNEYLTNYFWERRNIKEGVPELRRGLFRYGKDDLRTPRRNSSKKSSPKSSPRVFGSPRNSHDSPRVEKVSNNKARSSSSLEGDRISSPLVVPFVSFKKAKSNSNSRSDHSTLHSDSVSDSKGYLDPQAYDKKREHKLKNLTKHRIINKINRSKETHGSSSGSYVLDDLEHDLSYPEFANPPSEQADISTGASSSYEGHGGILGNISIEPISRKQFLRTSSASSSSLGILLPSKSSNFKFDHGDYSRNSIKLAIGERSVLALPLNDSATKSQSLNFNASEEKFRDLLNEKVDSSSPITSDFSWGLYSDLQRCDATLQILTNHRKVQNRGFIKLFDIEKDNRLSSSHVYSLGPGIVDHSELKKLYESVGTSFEWVSKLLPIYLRYLTKEIERLSKAKSKIMSDESDKIDQLLSLSDRMISQMNTKRSVLLKPITEKAALSNNTTISSKLNRSDFALQDLAFTLGDYSIMLFLYFLWLVLSLLRFTNRSVLMVVKVLKWIFW